MTDILILRVGGPILIRVFQEVSTAGGAPAEQDRYAVRTTRVALLLLFSYVFLANHWVGDDAYITYRVVWNFVHGYGPTFNPDERVQAFTHPLWMLMLTGTAGAIS